MGKLKNEYCIMPINTRWSTQRFFNSHRHEIFGGANRKKSIEDGLVIFLLPQDHNMSNNGIHFNKEFNLYAKKIAEQTWMTFYNKTESDFIKRYGKSYLHIEE